MALVSEVSIGGRTLVTYNLHLESRGDDTLRCSQLVRVLRRCSHYKSATPIIVAGDLNLDASRSVAAASSGRQFSRAFMDQPVRTTPPRSLFDRGQLDRLDRHAGIYYALKLRRSTVRFQLRTITHFPSRWLLRRSGGQLGSTAPEDVLDHRRR